MILTNTQNNRTQPIIVKKWKKIYKPTEGFFSLTANITEYKDNDGWLWSYVKAQNPFDDWMKVENENHEEIFFVKFK